MPQDPGCEKQILKEFKRFGITYNDELQNWHLDELSIRGTSRYRLRSRGNTSSINKNDIDKQLSITGSQRLSDGVYEWQVDQTRMNEEESFYFIGLCKAEKYTQKGIGLSQCWGVDSSGKVFNMEKEQAGKLKDGDRIICYLNTKKGTFRITINNTEVITVTGLYPDDEYLPFFYLADDGVEISVKELFYFSEIVVE